MFAESSKGDPRTGEEMLEAKWLNPTDAISAVEHPPNRLRLDDAFGNFRKYRL